MREAEAKNLSLKPHIKRPSLTNSWQVQRQATKNETREWVKPKSNSSLIIMFGWNASLSRILSGLGFAGSALQTNNPTYAFSFGLMNDPKNKKNSAWCPDGNWWIGLLSGPQQIMWAPYPIAVVIITSHSFSF